MSMNFNNNNSGTPTPPPAAKPNKNKKTKTIAGIVIIGFITAFAAIAVTQYEQNNLNGYTPTAAEITAKCTEKIRELLQTEPTQYMIDVCGRTVNNEMNSPDPLSANPSVAEITAKCTELVNKEYGSAPQLAVNMCVGTVLQGLNK